MTALDRIPQLRRPAGALADTPAARVPARTRRRRAADAARGAAGSGVPRRRFLQGATVVGFATLTVFSAAREAYADGYDIWEGACPSYASGHDCSPGCGPSTVFADACVTAGGYLGFHRSDGSTWALRPNQCYAGTYDGWLWRFSGPCGTCGCGIERRCHDGYRNTGSGWVRSICRYTTDCGCPGSVDWPTVGQGSRGPDVTAVQHLLTFRGFATDPDGIYGPATAGQVSAFQADRGLPRTGVVNAATWQQLIATVRQGDRNHAVRAAQTQLTKHGHNLTADGIFGQLTRSATLDFQRRNGLTADGIIGQVTWRHLTGTA
jgi:hypothetical protein